MLSRKNKAERTAAQAWEYLSSAVTSAGDAGVHAVDVTSSKASKLADRAARKSSQLSGRAAKRSAALTERAAKRSAQLTDRAARTSAALAGQAAGYASQAQHSGLKLAEHAGERVSAVRDEAWTRAALAADALAGKRRGLPWALLIGVGLAGVAIGWAAASAARAAAERQAQEEELELAESAVVVTPEKRGYPDN